MAIAMAPKTCLVEKCSAESVFIAKTPWTMRMNGESYAGVTAGTDNILDLLGTPIAYRLWESGWT
jgi:hypothetical protein